MSLVTGSVRVQMYTRTRTDFQDITRNLVQGVAAVKINIELTAEYNRNYLLVTAYNGLVCSYESKNKNRIKKNIVKFTNSELCYGDIFTVDRKWYRKSLYSLSLLAVNLF